MKKLILLTIVLFTVACQQKEEKISEDKTPVDQPHNQIEVEKKYCTKDLKICPDGSSVSRNSENNCEFHACSNNEKHGIEKKEPKKKPMICTADVKECADGSFVSRDHYNYCKFKECPKSGELKDKI